MHPKHAAVDLTGSSDPDLVCHPSAGIAYQPFVKPFDYGEEYFENYVERKGTSVATALNRARFNAVAQAIGPLSSNETRALLDIGVGSGEFLEFMGCGKSPKPEKVSRAERVGIIRAYGYDINPVAIRWLKERRLFLDPYAGPIGPGTVITLWDTLEHMPEPDDLFQRMLPGSILCTSLPIYPVIDRKQIMASKHYKPNEHLYYFTKGGLINWLERSGFEFIFYSDAETKAGREGIGTFAFRKTS